MGLLPIGADILPPSDDRVFKLLMTSPESKPGLIKLIAGLVGRKVVDVTVHNNELPIGDTEEKAERFDVNCKIDDGSQINLEMQASRLKEESDGGHGNLIGKSIYYLCDLHSSQPSKGQRRYDKLARTYQITFCSYTIFPSKTDYVNSFSMRHDKDNELLHDAIHAIFVELSKLDEVLKKPVEQMTDLEKWSVFFQYAEKPTHRETVNKVIESEEVLNVAGELLMSISQNERERAIFRSRRKFQSDHDSDMATAEDIGRTKEKIEIARNLLTMNLSLEQINAATGLSYDEIKSITKK